MVILYQWRTQTDIRQGVFSSRENTPFFSYHRRWFARSKIQEKWLTNTKSRLFLLDIFLVKKCDFPTEKHQKY